MTFFPGIEGHSLLLLAASLGIALSFEFVNGFHDTANAVATVIYTRSLKARTAVILSGLCNFLGVHLGGIAVAYSIVHLLPVDLLVQVDTGLGMAMVFALLVSAILWNFGTWWLGLPASSSHTLIGSILGVGLAESLRQGLSPAMGVNWAKAAEVGLSLVISPVMGFVLAGGLLLAVSRLARVRALLDRTPDGSGPPPLAVRAGLIASGLGVSLAHGSNDGQKGVGLVMLILMGFMPGAYALDTDADAAALEGVRRAAAGIEAFVDRHGAAEREAVRRGALPPAEERGKGFPVTCGIGHAAGAANDIRSALKGRTDLSGLTGEQRWRLRTEILCLDAAAARLERAPGIPAGERLRLDQLRRELRAPTEYAPDWVLLAVSMALGLGTMIGWKRIVVTIGEKIGRTRMTYGQGLSAQLVAMTTIGLADVAGLPVSTTHVLSSGVAGTMAASRSGLQGGTLRSIALAWVLTLPAAMLLGACLFLLFERLV